MATTINGIAYTLNDITMHTFFQLETPEQKIMTTLAKQKLKVNMKICINEESLPSPKTVAAQPTYDQKLKQAEKLNAKLKVLYTNLKNNMNLKKIELESTLQSKQDKSALKELRKLSTKLAAELQYITQSLNMLISENQKLKEEVDNSRNSRVIYSNVYKNLEKEIRKMEYNYKSAIIENKTTEDTYQKIAEKLGKNVKKLEKQIQSFEYKLNLRIKRATQHMRNLESSTTNRATEYTQIDKSRKVLPSRAEKHTQNFLSQQKQSSIDKKGEEQQIKQEVLHQIKVVDKFMRSKLRLATPRSFDEYEAEMKYNYYDNLMKKLKQATKLDEISEIIKLWKDIQHANELEYSKYLSYEEDLRKMEAEETNIKQKMKELEEKEENKKEGSILLQISQEQQQLKLLKEQIDQQSLRLKLNQINLTQKIDVIAENLDNQELLHHIQRVKQRNKVDFHGKTLQKILQSAQKQKAVDNCIILPKNLSDSYVMKRN